MSKKSTLIKLTVILAVLLILSAVKCLKEGSLLGATGCIVATYYMWLFNMDGIEEE